MFGAHFRGHGDVHFPRHVFEVVVNLAVVVDHQFAEVFDVVGAAVLLRDLAELDLGHAAVSRFLDERFLLHRRLARGLVGERLLPWRANCGCQP